MMNIDDPAKTESIPAIWRLGFRPFFLGGAIVAALFIPIWIMAWYYPSVIHSALWSNVDPMWWHPHEMLFGFAMAIVCGFLLTAVQAWTNQPTITGRQLMLTFSSWLIARIVLLLPLDIPLFVPAAFDSLFLGLSALALWRCIYPVKQWRNIGFPIMLMVALVVNLVSYYAQYQQNFALATQLWQGMIWWLALVITIVGGRVIPFFTAMRIKQPKPEPHGLLENALISVMVILFTQGIFQWLPKPVEFGILLGAGVLHLLRFARWQAHKTLKEPMLWSLHISYLTLPVTLILMAINIESDYAYKTLLHLFAVGGIGSLCLSMISRVSLGHTSRNIYEGPNMMLAFLCLPVAAVFRAVMPLLMPEYTQSFLWAAAIFWFIGFGMFVWYYAPMLTRPRLDGRPG